QPGGPRLDGDRHPCPGAALARGSRTTRGGARGQGVRRALAVLPLAAIVALVALFAGFSLHRNPQVSTNALVGHPTPDVTLPALTANGEVRLREAARGPVLVNFFASWCGPCEVEHPALMALRAEGVRVIGVAYKDDPAASEAFLQRLGNPFSQVLVD